MMDNQLGPLPEPDVWAGGTKDGCYEDKPIGYSKDVVLAYAAAEVEKYRRDAERYRWLRTAGAWESEVFMDSLSENPTQFDAAVDAAMKESK